MMDLSKFGGAEVGCYLVVKDGGALGRTLWIVLRAQGTIDGVPHAAQEEFEFTEDAVRLIRHLPASALQTELPL